MPYELFLALRYLRSRRKRRLARATSVAAILGIAMGVAALIVAFALSNGFRDEMREKILQGTAHLSVVRADGRPLENYSELASRVKQVNGVVTASATTYDGALVRGTKGSSYAVIRGVEKDTVQSRWLKEGSFGPLFEDSSNPSAVVGVDLAARIGLSLGDVFQVQPANDSTPRRLRVAGVFSSGLFEYDSTWIYVSMETASEFAGNNHAASVMSVQVSDVDNVKQVSADVSKTLGNSYTIIDWQQANQPLFAALALERRMGLFIIGLIIAIATLNITTMLILVVVERRRDIAILSALGATPMGVMLLFIIEGAVVGAIGAAVGVVIGFIACAIGNHYKLISLPADVYSISNVPLIARPSEMLIAALVAFLLSVLATIYPARAASRMRPVEALRDS
ncbi:MAG TPA: ABC transporter permease [Pyrinomonadaceae bacterium]|nr:ABC transporter permease [Pyrinomonadaceae bacterium]